jgi:anti-anti-sigma factor
MNMPTTPGPDDDATQAAAQMARATDRLREQARALVDPPAALPTQRVGAEGDLFATFRTTSYAGRTVLTVAGQVDIANADGLRRKLAALYDGGHTDVVVDLSAVTFMDSSGLNVLVGAARGSKQTGGSLRVVAVTPHIEQLFTITGVHKVVPLYSTLAAAVTAAD